MMIGVWTMWRAVLEPERITLLQRLAPVRGIRVALTLLTSLFAFGGFRMVYTYAGRVLYRVTGGSGRILAGVQLV